MTSPVRTQTPLRAPRQAPSRPGSGRPESRNTPQVARPRRPDLRVVAEPRPRRRTGGILLAAGVVIFGSLLASAVFHSILVTGQDNLDRLDKTIVEEKADLQRAKVALAKAQSPERIAKAAAARGMVPADHQTWLSPDSGADPVVTGTVGETDPAVDGADQADDQSTTDDQTTTTDPSSGSTATPDGAAR